MREIKFRFWIKSEKRMEPPCDMWWNYIEYLIEDDCIVMQYTGLKDKDGVEIYEGDIVKLDSWQPKEMQIYFIEGAFCLANKEGHFVGDIHYIQHAGENQCKVIGNIYQNPELLK